MRTRLSLFCDKLIEAGWLAAVIIVPLFFNIYSQRVFEPDKLSLLRSIALFMIAAWAIRNIEDWRSGFSAEAGETGGLSLWQRIYKTPLVLPTLLLVIVYLVSTVASVAPRVSLLGSYQRLQGTYTTLSYIVVFFLLLQGLRTKRQLNRLINTMILVSFPVAMYGLVQHFGLDPLPWGGNVTKRVASNMGNAIFVAAFLIMVVPLTISRLLENWRQITDGLSSSNKVLAVVLPLLFAFLVALSWVLEIPFPPIKPDFFWLGLLSSVIFVVAMLAFAYYLAKPVSRLLLLAAYAIILIVQVACIFYTQSRGPWLGLIGGVLFYFAVLGMIRRKFWVPLTMAALVVAVALGLFLFNTVESPVFDTLRNTPYIGRLGRVLETESGTGKVRLLIWEGALDMISPHEPLDIPGEGGGPDTLNALRPLIGYGPESMYVAYNRFYPPDLAQYEKRNASPDRSHNETFDALVITGGLGFVVYMFVFASVFYYGLKWLGLVQSRRDMWLFVGLWILGATAGALGTWAWLGPPYLGVGIPLGVMAGLAIYVLVMLVRSMISPQVRQALGGRYALWMLALLSTVVAHFVEIHFGIAIAATRTYFWVIAGMMVVVGARLALQDEPAQALAGDDEAPVEETPTRRRRRRAGNDVSQRGPRTPLDDWQGSVLALAVIATLILSTMLFDFTTIQQGNPGMLATIWRSLTQSRGDPSPVMLVLLVVTWGMIALVGLGDLATRDESQGKEPREWLVALAVLALITLGGALIFALVHASNLKPVTIDRPGAANPLADTITVYYAAAFTLTLALAGVLAFAFRRATKPWRWQGGLADVTLIASAVVLPLLVVVLIVASNMSIVRADILYKQGLSSEKIGQWEGAIYFYDQAVSLDRNQDFYYLFLGRAFMERAKSGQGSAQDLQLAESSLLEAREIAPLNTDHSANLARLHRTWGGLSQGEARQAHLETALEYYEDALSLSPNNAQLWNEWGQTHLALGQVGQALAKYEQSLELDRKYLQTYLLLGELYVQEGRWEDAMEVYSQALELRPNSMEALSALAYAMTQQGEYGDALQVYLRAAEVRPNDYTNRKNLAILYQQMGRIDEAITEAQRALQLAPDSEVEAIQGFLAQLMGESGASLDPKVVQQVEELSETGRAQMDAAEWDAAEETFLQVLELSPTSPQAHSALAYIYARQGRIEEAIASNEYVIELMPNDWNSYKNLGLLYQETGRIDEAIAAVEQALALAPDKEKEALEAFLAQLQGQSSVPAKGSEPQGAAGALPPEQRNNLYSSPPGRIIDPSKSYQATIATEKGDILVELYAERVPNTVNNFVYLARDGFYDDTTFHRVLPDFMAQAGDPTGTGAGGPGYRFPDEFDPELRHDSPGVLSMANAGANTNGSQFFITYEPTPWLDGRHAVFGRVIEGMDVLRSLTPRDPAQNPDFAGDTIRTIEIEEQ